MSDSRLTPASPSSPAPEEAGLPPARERRRLLWEDWVAIVAFAMLASITFANVLVRYFTSQSFAWTEEISVSLMVVLAMAAGSAAVVRDRHIRIELWFGKGSAKRNRALALFSDAATLVAFVILAALGAQLAWDDYRYEVTSPGIGVPQWWYTVWLPVFAVAISLRALVRLVAGWRRP